MSKIFGLLLRIFVLFVVVHLLLISADIILIKNMINPDKLAKLSQNISRLETVSIWQRRLGFGLYSLPYFNDLERIVSDTIDISHSGLILFKDLETSLINSMNGVEVLEQNWDKIFDQTRQVSMKLDVMAETINSPRVSQIMSWTRKDKEYFELKSRLIEVNGALTNIDKSASLIKRFLGYEDMTHTIVLTQNNMELWPTGGYLGSYAEFYMKNGAMEDLKFQDIGVPNGQLEGYVEAPLPISKYVHNGQTPGWKLRESNWNPDFPQAMKEIEWFFVEGGVFPTDYMVAINLIPMMDLIREIGVVNLLDYNLELTADNFYEQTQKQTSYDFFDGSTQKRDYLNALGNEILSLVMSQPQKMMPAVIKVVVKNISQKQILIAAHDEETSNLLRKLNWDGSLAEVDQTDYLHINETNMGINKTNCCIERKVSDVITINESGVLHQLTLTFINNNPPKPNPPDVWGGGYKVYIRLYVPSGASLESISENGKEIDISLIDSDTYKDKQIIGFLGLIPGVESRNYVVKYEVPLSENQYNLRLVKQSGIDFVPWSIKFLKNPQASSYDFNLTYDLTVSPQYFENQISHKSAGDNR